MFIARETSNLSRSGGATCLLTVSSNLRPLRRMVRGVADYKHVTPNGVMLLASLLTSRFNTATGC